MKKRKKRELLFFIFLVFIAAISISLINAQATKITFNAFNAPWNLVNNNHYPCTQPPVLVDSGLTPGTLIKVSNIQGFVCAANRDGSTGCTSDLTKECTASAIYYCDESRYVKIGFYNSNKKLIKSYKLNRFIKGVKVPNGANSMYVYVQVNNYKDNNGYFNCTFFYDKITPPQVCINKTCSDYSGKCGNHLDNGCSGFIDCTKNCGSQICNLTGQCVNRPQSVCSSQTQTIIKLYNSDNSHGAEADSSDYTWDICYNHIFDEDYTGSSPNDCTGDDPNNPNNIILWLNSNSNAHASISRNDIYNIPVCYGDLACRTVNVSAGQDCDTANDEKEIVSLSSTTNAHISDVNIGHAYKRCCKQEARGYANWTDMNGAVINHADLYDSVKLIVNKPGLENKNISYSIYKQDAFLWFDAKISQISGIGFTTWRASESGTFTFTAVVQGTSQSILSDELEVSDQIDDSPPIVEIINPEPESNFTMDKNTGLTGPISFEMTAYDIDDDLNIIWNFGDGSNQTFLNCLTSNNCNTNHVYNKSGTKVTSAAAKEMTRSLFDEDLSRIFIYKEGLSIFAIIDSPYYREPMEGVGYYPIDGRRSHVANCSYDAAQCTATGGTCYRIDDDINISDITKMLYCYKFADYTRLNFRWKFDGVNDTEHTTANFTKPFSEPGTHTVDLNVRFTY